jgi:HAD superfamily hydrolase (TIGR01490 family)
MEKLRASACAACRGWPADRVTEIVTEHLKDLILPYVYAEAWALLSDHRSAGHDVIIVSTSGHEVVAPIGALLGVESVIATRMRIANGHYTGEMECYAYGEEKAVQVRRLAAERGYSLPDSYAYSDSVTDLPLLELVGHPRAVNPDRALRRIATVRGWPVLSFSSVREPPPGATRRRVGAPAGEPPGE